MHVPKAAGTSINAWLKEHFDEATTATQVEGKRQITEEFLARHDYVTGHIPFHEFAAFQNRERFFKIAFLRDPCAQLISHINWVRCLPSHPIRQHYESMGASQKLVAQKLNQIDLSDATVLEDFLLNLDGMERALFDNYQTRFMAEVEPGVRVTAKHGRLALHTFDSFDFVGVTEQFEDSVEVLCGKLGWDVPDPLAKLNQNSNPSPIRTSSPIHLRILKAVTLYDQALYDTAKARLEFATRGVRSAAA